MPIRAIRAAANIDVDDTLHAGLFTGPQGTGLDYNLLILAGCIALLAFGAGGWSLDAIRKKPTAKVAL